MINNFRRSKTTDVRVMNRNAAPTATATATTPFSATVRLDTTGTTQGPNV